MQSSTGQYSTQAGDPAQPVQHSVMTANSFGFFLRGVSIPLDLGSNLSSSGTIPTGLGVSRHGGNYSIGLIVDLVYPCAVFNRHIVHWQF